MASLNQQEKANFTRLSRLLVDKGTEALRITLDSIHPSATLHAVLNANRKSLLRLKFKVINGHQWDLLFPPSGNPPDSKTFDVTLLTVLLRNICGLPRPATGWNMMPPVTDSSHEANVTRIKLFRNQVYAHVSSTQVDNTTFENLWQKVSKALVDLNIPQKEVDDLKTCCLGPEEEIYVQSLKEWFLREEDSKHLLVGMQQRLYQSNLQQEDDRETIKTSMQHLNRIMEENRSLRQSENEDILLQQLAKHNFMSKIRSKVKSFHPGTRDWLLKKVENWFTKESKSRLLLITAGPGFGKSVFAAKVCELFKEKEKLAACHFCDFSDSNLKDPMMMLQSLASHMSENVPGFKEKLLDQLKRPHNVNSLKDAFQIYLQNSLDELKVEPRLIVIDGLDESATEDKSDTVKLIADHFPDLPKCVKVMMTSRPELSIERLSHIQMKKIKSNNKENELDILEYLKVYLPTLAARRTVRVSEDLWFDSTELLPKIAKKCEGSFLYAFHVQHEFGKREDLNRMTLKEIKSFLPEGMSSVYKEYFGRLEMELEAIMKKKPDLYKLLELLVAAEESLPLKFIARALDLDLDCRETKRIINKVNEAVSCLLYVSNDAVTVFHKSVYDWLLANGYDDHEYTVKDSDGKRRLWLLCESIFEEIKEDVSLGLDLKLTNDVKHALEYGHEYLLESNMMDTFSWLVDMVIVHVQTFVHPKSTRHLQEVFEKVLKNDVAISLKLRQRISWHLLEVSNLKNVNQHFSYLESVLDHSPEGLFTDDEKKFAEALIGNAPLCVKRTKTMSVPLAKLFPSAISAVGVSSNRKLAAVALKDGTICVLSLPELVELWQYSTKNRDISCCTFAPDGSFVLYGKLETALSIAKKKEISFFKGKVGTFKSCAFSPSGNRLVTNNGSTSVKLWDVLRQCLLTVLCVEALSLSFCNFSSTGLFIIAGSTTEECVWSAITFQRVDQRKLSVGKLEKGGALKSKRCNRCLRQDCKELIPSKKLIGPWQQLIRRGIYHEVDCIFYFYTQSLRVIESTHFTTLAVWESFIKIDGSFTILDIAAIEDDLWLYADEKRLIVFSTVPPKEHQSCPSLPTRVLWCSFSPDGARLASCTLDGFINIWNVNSCQVYQRFRDNVGTREGACSWSNEYLFVCHIIDGILSISKYPVDENSKIMTTQKQVVAICHVSRFSKILRLSESYLYCKCSTDLVKLFDVNKNEHVPQVMVLPGYEPLMNTVFSADASFVLGARSKCIIIWKRNESHPPIYEVFVNFDLRPNYLDNACFSNDSKFAVVCSSGQKNGHFVVFNLDTRAVVTHKIQSYASVMKVFSTGTIVIGVNHRLIEIFDLKTLKRLGFSYHDNLYIDYVKHSKLFPKGSVLAVPDMFGDMELFQLHIPLQNRKDFKKW